MSIRDVFYYGAKPNIHPREQFAESLTDARNKCSTEHFWIINEFCDYKNFDWDFDFEFLPDEDVWAESHNNVWPSQHQKDSGTWLCSKEHSDIIIYRNDVFPVYRKNESSTNWVELDIIDHTKFDFSWHPDPTDPPYIYKWGCKFFPAVLRHVLEYRVPGATQEKYMNTVVELVPQHELWVEHQAIDKNKFDLSWRPNPLDPPFIYIWGNKYIDGKLKSTLEYHVPNATSKKYMPEHIAVLPELNRWVEVQAVDKSKFDFTWRPDPREPAYIYTWGNKYIDAELKPTLEYHCEKATERKYMTNDVSVLPELNRWETVEPIVPNSFDFSWRPDPREPAYIYVFGNELFDAIKMPTVEYHCEGATDRKYMNTPVAKLAANAKLFDHLENSYLEDYSWLPDPDSPPYIYVWGNQWNAPEDKISVQFIVPGATEYKFMTHRAIRKPCMDNWIIPGDVNVDGFDFSWEPSPAAPPYIYEFGTQWQKTGGPKYVVPGATEKQYIDFQKATKLSLTKENWRVPDNIDATSFDFSWHPDDTSPPYIYVFATQWAFTGGPVYTVPGATEIKYVDDQLAIAKTNLTNWVYDSSLIDVESFDFSWHPNIEDQPYIYEFGTQWQKTGGPRYITSGADSSSPIKYIDTRIIKATRLPNKVDGCWNVLYPLKDFDFSWHPDITDEPFIYTFGNNLYTAEECVTVEYIVPGATERKYVRDISAVLDISMINWEIPSDLDTTNFDFSWIPNPNDPPYIYEFGTQHQKTGGPRYLTPDATEIKYLDFQKAIALSNTNNWTVPENIDTNDFDFSWHPDNTDPPYIYVFATQWAFSGGPVYTVPGATEIKYMDIAVARAMPDRTNWVYDSSLIDVESFDFSWHPNVEDQPYIYEFGTQWQKTGGPKYITPGADSSSPVKYIDTRIIKATRLPNKVDHNWKIHNNYKIKEFDFSWHPDSTEESFMYTFGNNLYTAEECATIEYRVVGATERKYVKDISAILDDDMNNWEIPSDIDTTSFDFSWVPNPNDPPYIYEFGTQHQKTGGPRYITPDATEIKYLDFQKAVAIPNKNNWNIPLNIVTENFDFSWHPDNTDPAYIYQFGTQWALSGGPSYAVPNATEIKYMDEQTAVALPNRDNWVYDPSLIDVESFDFSWHPYVEDQPYIYEFGTQWQKTGGPRYITPGANSSSPIKYIDTRILKAIRLPNENDQCWVKHYAIKDFDFSWHPDTTEEPFIYTFGNNLYSAEECATIEYRVDGASSRKYIKEIVATLDVTMNNWEIPADLDTTNFDFSWIPNPSEPPYIYEFGTQHQKTGGPRYCTPGATEIKYLDFQKAIALSNKNNWNIPPNVDTNDFDFSWHPDNTDPAYIYQFGTQWALSGGPSYIVPGATEIKYMDVSVARALPDMTNWVYDPSLIDVESFDFSWHPYVEDQPYIYEFGTQHQKTGGPRYITPGADSSSPIKYIDTRIIKAHRLPNKNDDCWNVMYEISDFDWSWHPDSTDSPYIYIFGNQWHAAEVMPTVEYVMSGAKEIKYIDSQKASLAPNMDDWVITDDIDLSKFDFTWRPNPLDPPYIYVWGNQWNKPEDKSSVQYTVNGATEYKYMEDRAIKLSCMDNWIIAKDVDISKFDFSWEPSPFDVPYIYQFGTQWQKTGGPKYIVKGATEIKYVADVKARKLPNQDNWIVPDNVDVSLFDFSWHPDETDDPYVYQFGTQWQKTGGPRYITPGADSSSPIKYIDGPNLKTKNLPNRSRFTILGGAKIRDFDWSWHPDDSSPPYIYQFGNNWYPAEEMPTIEYKVEGATEAKFMDVLVAKLAPNMDNWKLPIGVDVTRFDFSWIPHPAATPYVYQFGTSSDSKDGPVYATPGNTGETVNVPRVETEDDVVDMKEPVEEYVEETHSSSNELIDLFFVDRGNPESAARFEVLKAKFGTKIQKTRYLNSWVDTINRCSNRATGQLLWVLNSELDYTDFDFSYYPNLWQMKMVHVFGTQWSHWGTTFLVNRETFSEDTKYIKIIEHLSNLNFVKTIRAKATACVHDVVMIDHSNSELLKISDQVEQKATRKLLATIQYDESYLNTLKTFIKKLPDRKEHYLWVCSSVCDYSTFDFSYVCDPFAKDNLHVFPSGKQKFGDTFLLDVNKTKEIINDIESLELYTTVNYNRTLTADRLPAPQIVTTDDTLVDTVKTSLSHSFPYSIIMTEDNMNLPDNDYEPMNLWEPKTKNIISTSTGNSRLVVPKEASDYVTKELYEYPYIKRAAKLTRSNPLDIVFLSNGEKGADENYEHLLEVTRNLPNRVVRVDGINGRVAAYHAAAEASNTAWMFTVFAKLKVSNKFDWNWQPDRMQVPKHYIFHAKNPVNGLTYGHQAIIAYNKKLTLANQGNGLDFTLDDEHEVVPLISGTAHYNTDEFSTWRTAFREVIKLKADTTDIARDRLDAWLNNANGDFSQYSIKGALDADEYYTEVGGDFSAIKLSYEWDWLLKKFSEV
jgi:hypothetical protein